MQVSRVVAAVAGAAAVLCAFVLTADAQSPSARPGPVPITQTLGQLGGRAGIFFGTAVDMTALDNEPTYRARVASEFSSVTPENVMKWQLVEPTRGVLDFTAADELVSFARANHQRVRGHTLVWHNQLPTWLTSGVADGSIAPDQLRDILRQHILDEVGHFKGRVAQWDVVNEALNEDGTFRSTIWLQQLGPGYIADAFRWAHQADPGAKLFYNDFNLESLGAKSDAALKLVQDLRSQGVHVDGIGIQGHLGAQFPAPGTIQENLKRMSDAGFLTEITEGDVRIVLPTNATNLEAQAEGYRVLLDACLLTRHCGGLTVWGFTDLHSWVPGVFSGQGAADVLDANFQPKPAYNALRTDLVLAARSRGDD
jgi:endo-1,4-beta-xylanase